MNASAQEETRVQPQRLWHPATIIDEALDEILSSREAIRAEAIKLASYYRNERNKLRTHFLERREQIARHVRTRDGESFDPLFLYVPSRGQIRIDWKRQYWNSVTKERKTVSLPKGKEDTYSIEELGKWTRDWNGDLVARVESYAAYLRCSVRELGLAGMAFGKRMKNSGRRAEALLGIASSYPWPP